MMFTSNTSCRSILSVMSIIATLFASIWAGDAIANASNQSEEIDNEEIALQAATERILSTRQLATQVVENIQILLDRAKESGDGAVSPADALGTFEFVPPWSKYQREDLVTLGIVAEALRKTGYSASSKAAFDAFRKYILTAIDAEESSRHLRTLYSIYFHSVFPPEPTWTPPDSVALEDMLQTLREHPMKGKAGFELDVMISMALSFPERYNESFHPFPPDRHPTIEEVISTAAQFRGAGGPLLSYSDYLHISSKSEKELLSVVSAPTGSIMSNAYALHFEMLARRVHHSPMREEIIFSLIDARQEEGPGMKIGVPLILPSRISPQAGHSEIELCRKIVAWLTERAELGGKWAIQRLSFTTVSDDLDALDDP